MRNRDSLSQFNLAKTTKKQGDIPLLESKIHQCSNWHTCWILKERFCRFSKSAFVMALRHIPVSSHNSKNHRFLFLLIFHLLFVCGHTWHLGCICTDVTKSIQQRTDICLLKTLICLPKGRQGDTDNKQKIFPSGKERNIALYTLYKTAIMRLVGFSADWFVAPQSMSSHTMSFRQRIRYVKLNDVQFSV